MGILTLPRQEAVTPTGRPAFDAARAASPLIVTDRQLRGMRSAKATAVVWMRPIDFLQASTWGAYADAEWAAKHPMRDTIEDFTRMLAPNMVHAHGVQALSVYNDLSRSGEILVMPMLGVDLDSGQVDEHEGRHRAVALWREHPEARLPVAIILKLDGRSVTRNEDDDPLTADDVPRALVPQRFPHPLVNRTRRVRLDPATFHEALSLIDLPS